MFKKFRAPPWLYATLHIIVNLQKDTREINLRQFSKQERNNQKAYESSFLKLNFLEINAIEMNFKSSKSEVLISKKNLFQF